jgi:hypothetical protein
MTSRERRIAFLTVDGVDPATVRRHLDELPAIAAVIRRSREIELSTQADFFLSSVWPNVVSGVGVANHGIHAFRPLRSGTLDLVEGHELAPPTPFWETAVRSGLRATVADVPFCRPPAPDAGLDGLRLVEWGSHPPVRPAGAFPPALGERVVARYGQHPCRADDPELSTPAECAGIVARLCDGARKRGEMFAELFARSDDLMVGVFAEAHTAGHQFLNLEAPGHPHHDASVAAALGESPVLTVLRAVDAALGPLLATFEPNTTILLGFIAGVRVTYGGGLLLGDLLTKLGLCAPPQAAPYRRWVPEPVKEVWRRVRRPRAAADPDAPPSLTAMFDWSRTRAFALPWAYDGYLRVNLRGREPKGIVEPGAERDALLDLIEREVRALRIAGTDKPAAAAVIRAGDELPGRHAAELPDLMVLWNNGDPIDAVESPSAGVIHNTERGRRSAHTTAAGLFAYGPDIASGPPVAGARDVDIAPTVLSLLGVTPPAGLDGRAIEALLHLPAATRA